MLTFITSNRHKFKEAKEIFKKHGIEVRRISRDYEEIQAASLEEVVERALLNISDSRATIIEDSGLFIDALNGFPGVYSSYVLKTLGNTGILKLMEGVKKRKAEFQSVVGYIDKDRDRKIFKGRVEGDIAYEIKGKGGFGYDPIFVPEGYKKTFAEDLNLKNRISHRRRALGKLAEYIGRNGHEENSTKT